MKFEKPMLAFASILCLSLLFTLNSCKEQTRQAAQSKEPEVVKAPEQIISVAQAKNMYEQYSKRRAPLILRYEDSISKGEKEFDVARYTYYDYATIKQYLAYIEQEAEKAGVEIASLRFYFSNYPDQETFENGKKVVHPRQNSIFLMPTVKSEGRDYGFYIQEGESGSEVMLLNGQLQPYTPEGIGVKGNVNYRNEAGLVPTLFPASSGAPVGLQGDKSLILNEGNSAPPPYH